MPNTGKNIKPQYEEKSKSIIPPQRVAKIDKKKEFSNLSKIIDESKKIEEALQL